MTPSQCYVNTLIQLLTEYGRDSARCDAIQARAEQEGAGLLGLLLEWYAHDHPELVRVTKRDAVVSGGCGDGVIEVLRCGGKGSTPT